MRQVLHATVRTIARVVETILEMISVVCVGFAVTEGKAQDFWAQVLNKILTLLEALFPVAQHPAPAEFISSCHFYPEGRGLTLARIAQSIQPRAPSH